jgi:hypothetical protein
VQQSAIELKIQRAADQPVHSRTEKERPLWLRSFVDDLRDWWHRYGKWGIRCVTLKIESRVLSRTRYSESWHSETHGCKLEVNSVGDETYFGQNYKSSAEFHLLADVITVHRSGATVVRHATSRLNKVVEAPLDHVCDECYRRHIIR